jgi:hypothetical protein
MGVAGTVETWDRCGGLWVAGLAVGRFGNEFSEMVWGGTFGSMLGGIVLKFARKRLSLLAVG